MIFRIPESTTYFNFIRISMGFQRADGKKWIVRYSINDDHLHIIFSLHVAVSSWRELTIRWNWSSSEKWRRRRKRRRKCWGRPETEMATRLLLLAVFVASASSLPDFIRIGKSWEDLLIAGPGFSIQDTSHNCSRIWRHLTNVFSIRNSKTTRKWINFLEPGNFLGIYFSWSTELADCFPVRLLCGMCRYSLGGFEPHFSCGISSYLGK